MVCECFMKYSDGYYRETVPGYDTGERREAGFTERMPQVPASAAAVIPPFYGLR